MRAAALCTKHKDHITAHPLPNPTLSRRIAATNYPAKFYRSRGRADYFLRNIKLCFYPVPHTLPFAPILPLSPPLLSFRFTQSLILRLAASRRDRRKMLSQRCAVARRSFRETRREIKTPTSSSESMTAILPQPLLPRPYHFPNSPSTSLPESPSLT